MYVRDKFPDPTLSIVDITQCSMSNYYSAMRAVAAQRFFTNKYE